MPSQSQSALVDEPDSFNKQNPARNDACDLHAAALHPAVHWKMHFLKTISSAPFREERVRVCLRILKI